jgi:peptidoglycan/LPS O-acetylase OafA/YrhL
MDQKEKKYIHILDQLRGLAALWVCLFHFACRVEGLLPQSDPIRTIASFGWLGVESFFVISGFVIPYSLFARNYTLSEAHSFMLRRLKRLEPPYIASIVLVLALIWISSLIPGYDAKAAKLTWGQVFGHLAYANAFLEQPWLIPVFWTLAIEFQFYIFISVAFVIVNQSCACKAALSVLAIAVSSYLLPSRSLLIHWLPLFAIGIATFQFHTKQFSLLWLVCIWTFVSAISFHIIGSLETVVGVVTACSILVFKEKNLKWLRPLTFVGTISYSLYLVHVPIGVRLINLSMRLPRNRVNSYLAIIAAFAVSIAFAAIFWKLVECPSQKWSKQRGLRCQPQIEPLESPNETAN